MATGGGMSLQIHDISDCSICLESFKEPKVLPCIHTFCLQCIDTYCKDKDPGKETTCPLCRKAFVIPAGGVQSLPNNFFIHQLLQVISATTAAQESNKKQILCEWCADLKLEIPATVYSIDCGQHICDRCSRTHKKVKLTTSHQIVRKGAILKDEKRLIVRNCDQHPGEQNRLYCYDCKTVMCHRCVNKHTKHELIDVSKAAEKFREHLKRDTDKIATCSYQKDVKINQLESDKKRFMEEVAFTQSEISQKYDELVSLIQSHQSRLIEELNSFKDKILKEMANKKDEIETQSVMMQSFMRYGQEMINKGTACDISRVAHDLHARAEELVKTPDEPDCPKLSGVLITFKPFVVTTDLVRNYIRELVFEDEPVSTVQDDRCEQKIDLTMFLETPLAHHVIPGQGQQFAGITVLGSNVFVVRDTSDVDVYNSTGFTSTNRFEITGSNQLRGIISCSKNNCLYVSDPGQKIIYKYDLSNKVTTKWSVGGTCYGMSVTKCYNVLATLYDARRIQEYTTHGSLIREIGLNGTIVHPRHCIQMSTGNFVVSHLGGQHRVYIIDAGGHIIQSYGGSPGKLVGQLNYPRHLAVDAHDNVLVADFSNSRVLLLSSKLTYLGDIVVPGHQLNHPNTLHFDEQNNRLCIGEITGQRIFVLDVDKRQ